MQPKVLPEEYPRSYLFKITRWIIGGFVILLVLIPTIRYLLSGYIFYYVPQELPPYTITKNHHDDTLRIALIGDSWADYHTSLSGDTIIANAAKKIFDKPVKSSTRGKKGALSKEIYYFMFSDKTEEHSYEPDRCTQPLIEDHPDYCVVFAGINDVTYRRTTFFYTENLRFIIKLLLHNDIRPVVMEIPIVNFTEPMTRKSLRDRCFYFVRSLLMGTINNEGADYHEALNKMLDQTRLKDSVLFISAKQWNPGGSVDSTMFLEDQLHMNLNGYHKLDSCIASEVIKDYISRQSSTSRSYND